MYFINRLSVVVWVLAYPVVYYWICAKIYEFSDFQVIFYRRFVYEGFYPRTFTG